MWTNGTFRLEKTQKKKKRGKRRDPHPRQTDRQETNQKQKLVTVTGVVAISATTEQGINSNCPELFTACTHHTRRMPAWQRPIILQVLHEWWLSYPLTLFVLHPSRYSWPIRLFPHVALAVGHFGLRARSPGCSKWEHFLRLSASEAFWSSQNPNTKVQTQWLCTVQPCPCRTVMELHCLLQKLLKYAQIFKSLLSRHSPDVKWQNETQHRALVKPFVEEILMVAV